MKLLHIDSSIHGADSVSRELSHATVTHLRQEIPNLDVTYRDLAADPVPHLTGATFAAGLNPDRRAVGAMTADLPLSDILLHEFLTADIVVIGVAFYNLTVPSQLKAWIDRVVVAGKTFQYGAGGVVGLATGKRLILAVARGGWYGPRTPMVQHEHAESYLRSIFGLVGVAPIEVIAADGVAKGPDVRAASLSAAHAAVGQL